MRIPTLVVLILSLAAPARGDIYEYKDKNGVIHLTNVKPRGKKGYKVKLRTSPPRSRKSRSKGPIKASKYDGWITEASRHYRVPETLIRAVIQVESAYNPRALSRVGAMGLMQLMPATAKAMKVYDAFDPRDNIFGGVRFLRRLADRFNGDLVLTIAGYHAGPEAVMRYQGIPPYDTTKRYVRMVLRVYYQLKKAIAQKKPKDATQGG